MPIELTETQLIEAHHERLMDEFDSAAQLRNEALEDSVRLAVEGAVMATLASYPEAKSLELTQPDPHALDMPAFAVTLTNGLRIDIDHDTDTRLDDLVHILHGYADGMPLEQVTMMAPHAAGHNDEVDCWPDYVGDLDFIDHHDSALSAVTRIVFDVKEISERAMRTAFLERKSDWTADQWRDVAEGIVNDVERWEALPTISTFDQLRNATTAWQQASLDAQTELGATILLSLPDLLGIEAVESREAVEDEEAEGNHG